MFFFKQKTAYELRISDLSSDVCSSDLPFNFYEEFQVKTGGYSAEFGRSTGGVINAVTRSGGNEFHAGAQVTLEPRNWSSERKDHRHSDGTLDERNLTSRDGGAFYKANVWAAGPLIKDKLRSEGRRGGKGWVNRC